MRVRDTQSPSFEPATHESASCPVCPAAWLRAGVHRGVRLRHTDSCGRVARVSPCFATETRSRALCWTVPISTVTPCVAPSRTSPMNPAHFSAPEQCLSTAPPGLTGDCQETTPHQHIRNPARIARPRKYHAHVLTPSPPSTPCAHIETIAYRRDSAVASLRLPHCLNSRPRAAVRTSV